MTDATLSLVEGSPEWHKLRKKCQTDLYWLADTVLGYGPLVPMDPAVHGLMCKVVTRQTGIPDLDDCPYRKIEVPRGVGKTTLITISYAIQRILRDPNVSILICNEREQNAKDFLSEIKHHFDSNDLLRALFPDICPEDKHDEAWSSTRITVRRTSGRKEPTVFIIGVGGTVTGTHPDLILVDDMLSREAMENSRVGGGQLMQQLNRWLHQLKPLLNYNYQPFPEIIFVGTRWWFGDSYEHIEEWLGYQEDPRPYLLRWRLPNGQDQTLTVTRKGDLVTYTRSAIEDGRSMFPAKWTLDDLAKMRMEDPVLFACFPPEQRVDTSDGPRPIAEVAAGQRVRTHTGQWQPVESASIRHYHGPMVGIRGWGHPEMVWSTPTHGYWGAERARVIAGRHESPTPEWRDARHYKVGDVLCTPIPEGESWPEEWPENLRTPDIWWLIGHFLGDGCVGPRNGPNSYAISHAFHPTKEPEVVAKVQRIVRELGRKGRVEATNPTKGFTPMVGGLRITYGHPTLGRFFWSCRGHAKGQKHLPTWVETIPVECQKAMLDGWLAADGHNLRGRRAGVSVSLYMLSQFQRIVARWGEPWVISRTASNHRAGHQQLYCFSECASKHRRTKVWIDGTWLCRRIRLMAVKDYDGPVCNLSVAEDHSYSLPGNVVVRNSNYMNKPTDDLTAVFKPAWLLFYDWVNNGQVKLTKGDGSTLVCTMEEMDKTLYVDPGGFGVAHGGDTARAALVMVGDTRQGQYCLLDCFSERDTFLNVIRQIVFWCHRYRPRKIKIEQAGQQASFIELVRRELATQNIAVTIEVVTPKSKVKEQRILYLEPFFQRGMVYIGRGAAFMDLRSQLEQFPRAARNDLLDALAYAADDWAKQSRAINPQERHAAELAKYRERRGLTMGR